MPTMYVMGRNHLDLTWRRCFERYFSHEGYVIRPYSEIEEQLLDWWFDNIEKKDMTYEIEQTITLRKYLERNPDAEDRIRTLIKSGKLRILGGGESVIDYNLPDGEDIIRNHFYSRRYLKEKFDTVPKFAACPDTFGLSAGLPQLFRQLGYTGISTYARVFQGNKPIWEGISGDRIALDTAKVANVGLADFVKYPACSLCHGEGCPSCNGTGFDINYRNFTQNGGFAGFENFVKNYRKSTDDDMVIMFGSEEVLEPDNFYEMFKKIAAENGYVLKFSGAEELIQEKFGSLIKAVESDNISSEMIDPRPEGNPVGSGCYVSRIRVKQENRKMEALMQAAERLSVLAVPFGLDYPSKTFERLWNKVSFYQFHDAIPASHSDSAYHELLDVARDIRTSANRLIGKAAAKIIPHINIENKDGTPFVVFNTLGYDVKNASLEGIIRTEKYCDDISGYIVAPDGKKIIADEILRSDNYGDTSFVIKFKGDVPALGYTVFRFVAETESNEIISADKSACRSIENEKYLIKLSRFGIEEIYDKQLGKTIAVDGVCSPYLEEDAGHLWGRMSIRGYSERADKPFSVDFMTPSHKYAVNVTTEIKPNCQKAFISVTYDRHEERLENLEWKLIVTLHKESDLINFHIDTLWSAQDLRLMARFPLNFNANNRAVYEIPLGSLEREYTEAFDGQLGYADDYAALRYVCVHNDSDDYTFALYNTGTPAHRVINNTVYVSLQRSPTRLLCGYDIDEARESEPRSYDFAVSSWAGNIENGNPAKTGWILNSAYPVFTVSEQNDGANLPESASLMELPKNAVLSALKYAEDGSGIICRYYEPYGKETELVFKNDVAETDILESGNLLGDAGKVHSLKKFGLKTFKII